MQKDDRAGVDARQKLGKCFFFGWLLILHPVHIGETPEKGLVAELLCHLQVRFTVFALRWTVIFFHCLPGDGLVECFQGSQLLFKCCFVGNAGHIGMVIRVVGDGVTLCDHLFYQFRTGFEIVADDEKGCRDMVFFQCFQNGRCAAVFISGVEGQIDDGLGGIAYIESIKIF